MTKVAQRKRVRNANSLRRLQLVEAAVDAAVGGALDAPGSVHTVATHPGVSVCVAAVDRVDWLSGEPLTRIEHPDQGREKLEALALDLATRLAHLAPNCARVLAAPLPWATWWGIVLDPSAGYVAVIHFRDLHRKEES